MNRAPGASARLGTGYSSYRLNEVELLVACCGLRIMFSNVVKSPAARPFLGRGGFLVFSFHIP